MKINTTNKQTEQNYIAIKLRICGRRKWSKYVLTKNEQSYVIIKY